MFLLQNEEMKQNNEICMKITKNRFSGRTDTFLMNIDYEKMRFSDMIIEGADKEFSIESERKQEGLDDFGIITAEKQTNAESFATKEVKSIEKDSWKAIKEADRETFNSTEDILKELGL